MCDKKVHKNLEASSSEWWLNRLCCMEQSVGRQELRLEDENCVNCVDEDVEINVWA